MHQASPKFGNIITGMGEGNAANAKQNELSMTFRRLHVRSALTTGHYFRHLDVKLLYGACRFG